MHGVKMYKLKYLLKTLKTKNVSELILMHINTLLPELNHISGESHALLEAVLHRAAGDSKQ